MTGRLEGKVAFISGAARGQGRAHAVRLAEEGADIIAFDAAAPVPSQGAPAATPQDLAETVREVEKRDRRIVARQADARDLAAVTAVLDEGLAEYGRVDVVVANAGIVGNPGPVAQTSAEEWQAVLDTNLTGVFHTVRAAVPHLIEAGRGGSISLVSSSVALRAQPGLGPYNSSKTGVVGLMRVLALELGEHSIRVNAIHPTTVGTPMIFNEVGYRLFRPDLADPQLEDVEPVYRSLNVLPVAWVEPEDIANAVVFLASEEGRYITGVALPVDAGYALK
ncbi:mycofactocin-coupled SDR family oxidoreductase [Streptomyces mirabilis]|uniref:(+)-trans-carveol dehydrogenase n=1 Tax=Streptomyces mirabilis TaxID=68239 RepID=A0A1I2XHW6_9ACTN|nr:mycofactocin-coupled SDR family oxidoreductase [Streptomyces mirabilis]SFH13088.1 (+)-trans-carveol dehydrogenase [Streptomyces mirabilis]